jgi:hypothetical protein
LRTSHNSRHMSAMAMAVFTAVCAVDSIKSMHGPWSACYWIDKFIVGCSDASVQDVDVNTGPCSGCDTLCQIQRSHSMPSLPGTSWQFLQMLLPHRLKATDQTNSAPL